MAEGRQYEWQKMLWPNQHVGCEALAREDQEPQVKCEREQISAGPAHDVVSDYD